MADSSPPPPLQRPDGASRASNPHKGRTGLERIRRAAGYSAAGLAAAFRGESAFRQEVFAATLMLPAAFWIGRGWVEISLLAGSVLLVLVVELLNSAIEAVVDRVGFELHELSKRAKDLGSAAVMLSLLLAGGIWIGALWQRLA
ncbi:diacylglycerol kinase [Rubrivivax gelatinosus]|uniref:Diacylglycerol kinase n=1 Tax=Rubrivivax gelatinosus TaxID=28068 RepID=A0ABS1DQK1_RUBGE|nr:diacylglycerol kinase [Rubrivivax gelatinosus]MBK1614769.1 diacylglycerol kinase [Rubrivivax gelatinosus]MBK1712001.1 diacylglycerol kinase [Rubrivivax gelatinosus]MBZ8143846.1 diacylglycerol kinase [Rubrivivax gelatinosus]